jgi:protein-tyrosine phosphatase
MNPDPFRVLHVCVGNVCRSVLAEHLMRDAALRLARGGNPCRPAGLLTVASAGTQAVPGRAMNPHIAAILAARGIRPDGFRSTRFTPTAALGADLILTATRAERNAVVAAKPAALRRTFTLNEFARLAPLAAADPATAELTAADPAAADPGAADPAAEPGGASEYAARARLTVATALTLRGYIMPPDPLDDDIADPDPTPDDFAACAVTIAGAVHAILNALYGTEAAVPARILTG